MKKAPIVVEGVWDHDRRPAGAVGLAGRDRDHPRGHGKHRGVLETRLTYKEPGAPSGQKSLPAAVFEQLQARLATSSGFASYIEIQQWLREASA
jgi:hypothetical protein